MYRRFPEDWKVTYTRHYDPSGREVGRTFYVTMRDNNIPIGYVGKDIANDLSWADHLPIEYIARLVAAAPSLYRLVMDILSTDQFPDEWGERAKDIDRYIRGVGDSKACDAGGM